MTPDEEKQYLMDQIETQLINHGFVKIEVTPPRWCGYCREYCTPIQSSQHVALCPSCDNVLAGNARRYKISNTAGGIYTDTPPKTYLILPDEAQDD